VENEKMYRRLAGVRPRVGRLKQWEEEHRRKASYGRIYRKSERRGQGQGERSKAKK
jgi:hypothetical protein